MTDNIPEWSVSKTVLFRTTVEAHSAAEATELLETLGYDHFSSDVIAAYVEKA